MKIVKFEVVHVRPRYSFLQLHTDDGIVGIGEACLEGKARVVQAALREFEELLMGQDPRRIEHLWNLMYRSTFYPSGSILCSAISAIAELTAKARRAVADGFTMIKTALPGPARPVESRGFVKLQVERFAALRDAVGDDVDIAIDFHGRVSPAVAKVLIAELAPLSPLFVEEPCLPENVPAMADIARSTTVPIATGERLFTLWGFREVLEKSAAAVLQPDLAHSGGISEARKIAAMGETYFTALAPHNPLGPVNLAASVHLALTVPGFLAQEQLHLGAGLVRTPFEVVDGHVAVPTAPGLGVELLPSDELAEEVYDGGWTLPVWHTADGAVAPW